MPGPMECISAVCTARRSAQTLKELLATYAEKVVAQQHTEQGGSTRIHSSLSYSRSQYSPAEVAIQGDIPKLFIASALSCGALKSSDHEEVFMFVPVCGWGGGRKGGWGTQGHLST